MDTRKFSIIVTTRQKTREYIAFIKENQSITVAAAQSSWNRDRLCLGITLYCLENKCTVHNNMVEKSPKKSPLERSQPK
jgi:hypothetical protein